MTTTHVVPVVLSGGSGTRLWPSSRKESPKQLLPLAGNRTVLHDTLRRVSGLEGRRPPLVVCNEIQAEAVAVEVALAGEGGRLVIEPVGRNTAPAIAAAALVVEDRGDLLLVMPADHVIGDVEAFLAAVIAGMQPAAGGALVTFGVVPAYGATGYGYIEVGEAAGGAHRIARFVEKPDQETADAFVAGGTHLWNSGMYLFQASRYLGELGRLHPAMLAACESAVDRARIDEAGNLHLDPEAFAAAPADSIDYAVMEHTDAGIVVPLDAAWTDLGSWASVNDIAPADEAGNTVVGDVVTLDTSNSYLRSEHGLLAVIGVDGIAAITTPDATLITSLDRTEEVKPLVEGLVTEGRAEVDMATSQHHLWGRVTVVVRHGDATVETVTVRPGHQVAVWPGHWVVLDGSASDGGRRLGPGGSLDVADGDSIRLANAGGGDLIMLAVRLPEDGVP